MNNSKIEKVLNLETLEQNVFFRLLLPLVVFLTMVFAKYYIFTVVPNERIMGPIQRVFYFHVSSAVTAYLMIAIIFVGSVFYLKSKNELWDILASSAASVAFLFCSIVLASGMIWGHSAWNTWWRWEPRLVSFLVLWLIIFSYLVLRSYVEDEGFKRNFSAVLGIIAALNIPIVVFSIKLLSHREQLHPEVIASEGLSDPRYMYGLTIAFVAISLFSFFLLKLKLVNSLLAKKLVDLEIAAQSR